MRALKEEPLGLQNMNIHIQTAYISSLLINASINKQARYSIIHYINKNAIISNLH